MLDRCDSVFCLAFALTHIMLSRSCLQRLPRFTVIYSRARCLMQFVLFLNWVISRRTASRRMGVDPLRMSNVIPIAAHSAFKIMKQEKNPTSKFITPCVPPLPRHVVWRGDVIIIIMPHSVEDMLKIRVDIFKKRKNHSAYPYHGNSVTSH